MSAAVAPMARRFAPKGAYCWPRALPALNVSVWNDLSHTEPQNALLEAQVTLEVDLA